MTNRLELNWKLDGFVDEQRYYCSEMPIDVNNLPTPKVVLAGDIRTYIDTDIVVGQSYYVRVGSVKNGVEKVSSEVQVKTGDIYFNYVDLLIVADTEANSYIDYSSNNRSITKQGGMYVETHGGKQCIKFDGPSTDEWNSVNGRLVSNISQLRLDDFTLETVAAYRVGGNGGARLWEIGTSTSNRSAILPAVSGYNGDLLLNGLSKGSYSNIYFDGVLRNHCLMRKSGVTTYHVDGVKIVETTEAIDITESKITIGTALSFNGPLQGWVHALRLTKLARYNASGFTPDIEFQKL